jgi:hypothetical protein
MENVVQNEAKSKELTLQLAWNKVCNLNIPVRAQIDNKTVENTGNPISHQYEMARMSKQVIEERNRQTMGRKTYREKLILNNEVIHLAQLYKVLSVWDGSHDAADASHFEEALMEPKAEESGYELWNWELSWQLHRIFLSMIVILW